MDDCRGRLEAELKLVEWWDEAYQRSPSHEGIEEDAFQSRQERREEVKAEMQTLPCQTH